MFKFKIKVKVSKKLKLSYSIIYRKLVLLVFIKLNALLLAYER